MDPERLLATIDRLARRIQARFPDRGLTRVATEIGGFAAGIARELTASQVRIRRDRVLARATCLLLVGGSAILLVVAALGDRPRSAAVHRWLPVLDSAANLVVFAGLGVLFLWGYPERRQRRTLLASLYRVRSLVDVVGKHQLAQRPQQLSPADEPPEHTHA
ncbi:MAG: hypothetical protein ACT4PP_10410, partial [Sporichthyaceae bacterium]